MITAAQSAARYMTQHNWMRDGVAEEQVAAVIQREINQADEAERQKLLTGFGDDPLES